MRRQNTPARSTPRAAIAAPTVRPRRRSSTRLFAAATDSTADHSSLSASAASAAACGSSTSAIAPCPLTRRSSRLRTADHPRRIVQRQRAGDVQPRPPRPCCGRSPRPARCPTTATARSSAPHRKERRLHDVDPLERRGARVTSHAREHREVSMPAHRRIAGVHRAGEHRLPRQQRRYPCLPIASPGPETRTRPVSAPSTPAGTPVVGGRCGTPRAAPTARAASCPTATTRCSWWLRRRAAERQ